MQVSKVKNLIEQNKSGAGEYAVVEGLHAIKHALRFEAKAKYLLAKDKEQLIALSRKLCPDLTKQLEQEVVEVGDDFDKLTSSLTRTGVLGVVSKPPDSEIKKGSCVLLDDPRDPDNIGAVVRVCAAADIKNLLVTGQSNAWNFRSIRAAAGLQFALNIRTVGVLEVNKLSLPIVCFDERGSELDSNLKECTPEEAIYVFGSERDGISEGIKSIAAMTIRLPMQRGVSSMNLATSVAAALYSLK